MNEQEYIKALDGLIRAEERIRRLEMSLSDFHTMQKNIGFHGADSIAEAADELAKESENICNEFLRAKELVEKLQEDATAEQGERLFIIEDYGVKLRLTEFSAN